MISFVDFFLFVYFQDAVSSPYLLSAQYQELSELSPLIPFTQVDLFVKFDFHFPLSWIPFFIVHIYLYNFIVCHIT